ncbi:SOSS complex subunit C-like [Lineus longissimus]|uniref:SOSS complex subunit C-like n=1 Tax=Lineus longissimus TaxID=88925 RepID=UPI002B4EDB7D
MMAFQAPSPGQGQQNKKLLEELEQRKKQLRMQSQPGNNSPTSSPSIVPLPQVPLTPGGGADSHMTPAQRTALQHAHANSVGYFITQDSSFGNLILPVLPRLDK